MDAKIIDATGKTVIPGLVDLHVHFREPGFEYKEDIETGSRAAAKGGVTTVLCMPNTNPPIDSAALVEYVINRGKKTGLINVLTTGTITKGLKGTELTEVAELKAAGASALSDDGRPVSSSMIMRRALQNLGSSSFHCYKGGFQYAVFQHSFFVLFFTGSFDYLFFSSV